MARLNGLFSSERIAERHAGDFTPHNPPKGGCVGVKTNPPMPAPADADREEKARMVREAFPVCTAVAAEFNAAFPGTRLVWASEGGRSIGKAGPDGVKLSETVVGRMFPPKVERR